MTDAGPRHLLTRITDSLVTPLCPLCFAHAEEQGLCQHCRQSLPPMPPHCRICATPLPQDGTVCGGCLTGKPAFDRAIAAFPYERPVDCLIRNIKYAHQHGDVRTLALAGITRFKRRRLTAPDCFVPVPLHRTRLRERGFNQALELARFLARHFNSRVDRRCIEKTAPRPPQTTLPADIRRRNARGAYALRRKPDAEFAVIVDDVMTTGATANEIARLLRGAGIRRTEAWVMARGINPAANQ